MPELLRRTGWIKLFRSDATLANAARDFERARQYGVEGEVLDGKAIAAREPNLTGEFAGAVYLPGAGLRSRSRRTGQGLCRAFHAQGRTLRRRRCANARTIHRRMAGQRRRRRGESRAKSWWHWDRGPIWCFVRSDIRSRSASSAATICIWRRAAMPCSHHPVLDADLGYLLAPMNRGIRLTTGVEFARRDAPPTPIQTRAGAAAGARRCFRWARRSTPNPGRARGRACRICCR